MAQVGPPALLPSLDGHPLCKGIGRRLICKQLGMIDALVLCMKCVLSISKMDEAGSNLRHYSDGGADV